jgi:hypothetical protein
MGEVEALGWVWLTRDAGGDDDHVGVAEGFLQPVIFGQVAGYFLGRSFESVIDLDLGIDDSLANDLRLWWKCGRGRLRHQAC